MSRRMIKRSQKAGLPPGTPMYLGHHPAEQARITVIHYGPTELEEKEVEQIEECFYFKDKQTVNWINVDGLHTGIIAQLGDCFGVPALVLEDILNTDQRPKLEDFGHNLYIVLKMLSCNPQHQNILIEQVSLVLGANYVLSFQEQIGDVFEPVRERIRYGRGQLRKAGPDYLAYTLLDAIVDNYFLILEMLGEQIGAIEEELLTNPTPKTVQDIHHLKREMIYLRKAVWPLREVITALSREEVALVTPLTRTHLRDVHDHTIQVIETIETYREMLAGMLELYLSSMSHKMNEVMRVLTV
ncbi:MAG TPA: magnesium/cobalt transporter CorA, partial [Anaerolineae bacterium]|nr:magnesium/cobalt transporter CorA [Anaerolineae bacterium]